MAHATPQTRIIYVVNVFSESTVDSLALSPDALRLFATLN